MNKIKLPRTYQEDLAALQYLRASSLKAAPTLRAYWKTVEQEFSGYKSRYRHPVLLKNVRRMEKASARHFCELYDRRIACFDYIANLRENANRVLRSCPYCGIPGDLTLDHYLPRSENLFPHLSVLTANLVPACMPCQRAKGTFYPGASRTKRVAFNSRSTDGRRQFDCHVRGAFKRRIAEKSYLAGEIRILHPYFDDIFSTRMMRIIDADGIKILAASRSVYRKFRLVDFHIGKLHLVERTALVINRTLDYIVAAFNAHEAKTVADAHKVACAVLKTAYGANRHGGSIDILVRHAVVDDPQLVNELFVRAQTSAPILTLESQVVDLSTRRG